MRDGEKGNPVRTAMEILIALGKIYGAEKMIPVRSAHVAGLSLKSHGIAGMEWAEDMAKEGARVCIATTLNVIGDDPGKSGGIGIRDPGHRFSQNGFLRTRIEWFSCLVREC